jgi:hypothetical protein
MLMDIFGVWPPGGQAKNQIRPKFGRSYMDLRYISEAIK